MRPACGSTGSWRRSEEVGLARRRRAADRRRRGHGRRRAPGRSRTGSAPERWCAARAEPPAARTAPRPAPDVPVAYEDEHLLVVDKPAGLLVHPVPRLRRADAGGRARRDRAGGGRCPPPGIVHRLDRDTSGLLVVARDDAHAREACRRCCAGAASAASTRRWCAGVRRRAAAASRRRSGATAATRRGSRSRPTCPATPSPDFELVEALPGRSLLRVELRDRAHAPDPRAPGRRSATPWWATRPTATAPSSASSASSCTPPSCASRIRGPASRSRCARRSRPTWRPRSPSRARPAASQRGLG